MFHPRTGQPMHTLGAAPPPSGGMSFSLGENGEFQFTQGGGILPQGQGALGRKAEGEAQSQLLAAGDALGRLDRMRSSFNRDFLTYGSQFKAAGLAQAEKLLAFIPTVADEGLVPGDYRAEALAAAIAQGRGPALDAVASEIFIWLVEDLRDGRTPMDAAPM